MAFSHQMILNLKHKALNTSLLQLNLMCNLNIADWSLRVCKQTGAFIVYIALKGRQCMYCFELQTDSVYIALKCKQTGALVYILL